MPDNIFEIIFLSGWIVAEIIRFPHRMRNKQERRQKKISESHTTAADALLDILAFVGLQVLPLVYVVSTWLDFADYSLPAWVGWTGAGVFVLSLLLLWRAHADLGRSWSPTLEIAQEHKLVTRGVYHYIRHLIYASVWLWGVAQALLVQNWLAGLGGLLFFFPVYLIRVPREEQMMLEHFGEDYRLYMNRTGRVIPLLWK
ncbi:MAG: protein-S-isoprenylcysteine O-methyltransferase [Anaerolineae bacterium]